MKYNCNLVRDLMPLYLDDVCSEESGRIVKEHLGECPECSRIFARMKNDEIETAVSVEREDVIRRQAGYFKRKSAVAGAVIAGILMIPVLVCLIVNLATGNGLGWYYVVLCSLLVAASLTVVPLMAPANKGLWTLGTFTGSLLLLLAVINLYTHSRFFLVSASAVLFAFSVVFLPFVARSKPVKALGIRHKGILILLIDTAMFFLMMFAIFLHSLKPGFLFRAIGISVPFIGLIWIAFLICYLLRCSRLIKAGICVTMFGAAAFVTDFFVNRILGYAAELPTFYFFIWNADTIDGNVKWVILLMSIIVGLILVGVGLALDHSRK